jgi:hypothetical protein
LQAYRNLNRSDHFRRLNFQEREEFKHIAPAPRNHGTVAKMDTAAIGKGNDAPLQVVAPP